MKHFRPISLFALAALALAVPSAAQTPPAPPAADPALMAKPAPPLPRHAHWKKLFDGKTFNGWYTFLPSKGKNNDPEKLFTVEPGGVIHIVGKEAGYIATNDEFENYRVRLEVKWGEAKWPPRDGANTQRDSGLLAHFVGEDKVWPTSIECQIQERDFGDFFPIAGVQVTVNGQTDKGRYVRYKDFEKPRGEWSTVEMICVGDSVTNIVNGMIVNEGTNCRVVKDGVATPLTKGKILIQSEWAEVYYRNIEILPLKMDKEKK